MPKSPLENFDIDALSQVQIELTYAKLYPLIARDFRAIGDCVAIHTPGNMLVDGMADQVPVTGAVTKYTSANPTTEAYHPVADAKQGEYEGKLKSGESILEGLTEGLLE